MVNHGPWQTEDFESLGWHDVHVHGFRFDSNVPDEGVADLVLDIDYILKWEEVASGFLFTLCQAELRFQKTLGLKLLLDYVTPTAGMTPFSIESVQRKPISNKSFHWHIPINWPNGSIEFDAPGFTQKLIGNPIVQSGQWLSAEQRIEINAA